MTVARNAKQRTFQPVATHAKVVMLAFEIRMPHRIDQTHTIYELIKSADSESETGQKTMRIIVGIRLIYHSRHGPDEKESRAYLSFLFAM